MALDRESVSEAVRPPAAAHASYLLACLVEGDPEQRARERRVRRKALFASVFLQAGVLSAVILLPLFAKPGRLVSTITTPIPPYRHVSGDRQPPRGPTVEIRHVCVTCVNSRPANLETNNRRVVSNLAQPIQDGGTYGIPTAPCPNAGCIDIPTAQPKRPVVEETRRDKPRVIHETAISPAMLTHRIEPVYPVLAKQTGRAGRVELRAVIATDGSIQSLQVVSGDPLFYQSAMEAVRQWRYRPTVLNGEAVEVDTFITVIYHLDR